jgi:hypothetical protein
MSRRAVCGPGAELTARVREAGGWHHLSKIEDEASPRLPALNLLESFIDFFEPTHLAFHFCSPGGMQFERLSQINAIPDDRTLDRDGVQDGLKDG